MAGNISKKTEEAIRRMKMWGLFEQVVDDFEQNGNVQYSDPPLGACYWLTDGMKARVKAFEEEHNALVYHVVRSHTKIGLMETYLYVSDCDEEWEWDREDIKTGESLAYVQNLTMPDCSEFGSVGIERAVAGGLKRVW